MEEIVLPMEGSEPKEKIVQDLQEINIARILSCSRRTINSYVEKGILPKPVSEKEGTLYFSREAVVETLGLKNLDEVLISIKEAAKMLDVNITIIESLVEEGRITEIRLKGAIKSKRFLIKREIEEFDIEIDRISKPLPLRKENSLIKILFSDTNSPVLQELLTEREFDFLKKVYVDKKSYEEIAEYYDLSEERVRQIFEKAMRKLKSRLTNAVPIMRRIVEQEVLEDIQQKYANKIEKMDNRLSDLITLVHEAENRIKTIPNLKQSIIENYYAELKLMPLNKLLRIRIVDLDFSVRALNCLRYFEVETLEQLVSLSEDELMKFRNIGKNSLEGIKQILSKLDLKMGMVIPPGNKDEYLNNHKPIGTNKGL